VKVDLFCMPTVPATEEDRANLRPIGRNTERYQQMLTELRELAVMADEYGIQGFSTTEHHFHTEGGEAMPNSILLYADLASRTQNIHFIPMSVVLTAANPIRVAEDIALLDHLTGGRVGVGFARGYQKRWVQVLSQGGPTSMIMGPEADALNREIFYENIDIITKAWTLDAFDHDGKHFQVPYPHAGIEGWGPAEYTRRYGSEGEIDENGTIRKIGVIPSPLTKPHPPVFIPFTGSPATLYYTAERGHTSFIYASVPEQFGNWCKEYQRTAAEHGRDLKLGQNIGAVRGLSIGDTYDEAFELAAKTTGFEFFHYWSYFGLTEIFRDPEKDDPNKLVTFKDEYELAQRTIDLGWQLCGTVDDVRRQMDSLHRCHGDGQLEWFQWNFFYQGKTSKDVQRRQLELFADKIWPDFR
jgi:alkanesulfonate monooxygenase SsuD/methylene tetrahydromethanopterin reductase-like flavin-dependent oxidoreductase (luciferase family)